MGHQHHGSVGLIGSPPCLCGKDFGYQRDNPGDSLEVLRELADENARQGGCLVLDVHDYVFDYQLLCFCSPESTEPVRITVRQDAVVAVVRQSDGLPAGTKYGWPRVDALFDDIQGRLDQHVARITVDYDASYGYPRSIVVDVAAMAADDEYSHAAGNLRPLP